MEEMTLTLNNPLTEEEWDLIEDVDFDKTNSIEFHTKHGKTVKFVKCTDERTEDMISRQTAIAEFSCCELTPDGGIDANYAIDFLKQLPSAQPTQPNTPNTLETLDCISRRQAIETLKNDMASLDHIIKGMSANDVRLDAYVSQRNQVNYDIYTINNLPAAKPEIIRCKDCRCWDIPGYCVDFMTQDENGFCSWAERRTDG